MLSNSEIVWQVTLAIGIVSPLFIMYLTIPRTCTPAPSEYTKARDRRLKQTQKEKKKKQKKK